MLYILLTGIYMLCILLTGYLHAREHLIRNVSAIGRNANLIFSTGSRQAITSVGVGGYPLDGDISGGDQLGQPEIG